MSSRGKTSKGFNKLDYRIKRKTRLLAEGRWDAFTACKARLVSEGMSKTKADEAAEIAFKLVDSDGDIMPVLPEVRPDEVIEEPVRPVELDGTEPHAAAEKKLEGLATAYREAGFVDESRFRQEKLTLGEVLEWVATKLSVKQVHPEDSPNSQAWAMLQWARNGKEDDFWKLFARRTQKQLEVEDQALKRRDNKLLNRAIETCRDLADQSIVEGTGK